MIESKGFYRRIERVFAGLPARGVPARFAQRLAPSVLEHLGGALAVSSAHVYDGRSPLKLLKRVGESRPDIAAEIGARLAAAGDAGITELPWVGETRAGRVGLLGVGSTDGPLLALFSFGPGDLRSLPSNAEFLSAINSLLYATRQHFERRELEDLLEQARAIQLSLLPEPSPAFEGFEIFARSQPAQSVGGDLYDFLRVEDGVLGITLADASGHGLPAALQARDVATGLRMGIARDLRITRLIEKLNRVIHQSGLSSRFVSLVFGELESSGNFSYVNAGHPAPLLIDRHGIRELSSGGMVLGPDPAASYRLGLAHLEPGSALVLYSDGVIERGTEHGEPFGLSRLQDWLQRWIDGPAEEAVRDLYDHLAAHTPGEPFDDDVTVVFVRRIDE